MLNFSEGRWGDLYVHCQGPTFPLLNDIWIHVLRIFIEHIAYISIHELLSEKSMKMMKNTMLEKWHFFRRCHLWSRAAPKYNEFSLGSCPSPLHDFMEIGRVGCKFRVFYYLLFFCACELHQGHDQFTPESDTGHTWKESVNSYIQSRKNPELSAKACSVNLV